MIGRIRFILDGAMVVIYFSRAIALIDAQGRIIMRDTAYPLYLVEYLLMQPDHEKAKWN